jgi:hypothetical protein
MDVLAEPRLAVGGALNRNTSAATLHFPCSSVIYLRAVCVSLCFAGLVELLSPAARACLHRYRYLPKLTRHTGMTHWNDTQPCDIVVRVVLHRLVHDYMSAPYDACLGVLRPGRRAALRR